MPSFEFIEILLREENMLILPVRVATQNTSFASSCPLAERAMLLLTLKDGSPEMNASIVSEYFMSYWAFRYFHILHI